MTALTQHKWKGDLRNKKNQVLGANHLYSKVDYEFIFVQASYLKVIFHEVEISKVNYDILIFLQSIP